VTLFSCTSPREICDYGLQTQIVSPLLDRFFYRRGFEPEAISAIPLAAVREAVLERLGAGAAAQAGR
jgi:hypothetical protein